MSSQCFINVKNLKVYLKHQQNFVNQLGNGKMEDFHDHPAMQSPTSAKSQCMTETGSSSKSKDQMIKETQNTQNQGDYEVQLSQIDNTEYLIQTICFKNRQQVDQVLKQYKQQPSSIYLPIVECQIEEIDENQVKLKIITQKFQNLKQIENYESLCKLLTQIIQQKIKIESNDIIQFFNQQLLINPIALFRSKQINKYIHTSLATLFQSIEINEELQQIFNIVMDFENNNLDQLENYKIKNQHIYMLQQKLINMLLKQMLESQL